MEGLQKELRQVGVSEGTGQDGSVSGDAAPEGKDEEVATCDVVLTASPAAVGDGAAPAEGATNDAAPAAGARTQACAGARGAWQPRAAPRGGRDDARGA